MSKAAGWLAVSNTFSSAQLEIRYNKSFKKSTKVMDRVVLYLPLNVGSLDNLHSFNHTPPLAKFQIFPPRLKVQIHTPTHRRNPHNETRERKSEGIMNHHRDIACVVFLINRTSAKKEARNNKKLKKGKKTHREEK
jgi:hypothetical protein